MNQLAPLPTDAQRYFKGYTSFQPQRYIFSLSNKRTQIISEVLKSNNLDLFIDEFGTDNIRILIGKDEVIFDIYKGKLRCLNKLAWKVHCKGDDIPECGFSFQIAYLLFGWRSGHGTCNAQLYRELESHLPQLLLLPSELPNHSGFAMAIKHTMTCKQLYVQDPGHNRTWIIEILPFARRAYDRIYKWPLRKALP